MKKNSLLNNYKMEEKMSVKSMTRNVIKALTPSNLMMEAKIIVDDLIKTNLGTPKLDVNKNREGGYKYIKRKIKWRKNSGFKGMPRMYNHGIKRI
jgi:hypothetical protein